MKAIGAQRADPIRIWVVSDGRAGIENQALGLAEAIDWRTPATIAIKRVRLREPWAWLPPGLVPAPRQALTLDSDEINPPWPHVWIACGRASISFSMGVRDWSRGTTLVVQLQDPRVNVREFDLVVPPTHDELFGQNVLATIGSCHRVNADRIAGEAFDLGLSPLGPRFAVLIGGKSKRQAIGVRRARQIAADLLALQAEHGAQLLVTLSRRTPKAARRVFAERLKPQAAVFYDGEGRNPYFALLAAADAFFVTADSVNMAAEAASTGKPVFLLAVDGAAGKLAHFHRDLIERGCARWFSGAYESWTYEPLQETERVARFILEALTARQNP